MIEINARLQSSLYTPNWVKDVRAMSFERNAAGGCTPSGVSSLCKLLTISTSVSATGASIECCKVQ